MRVAGGVDDGVDDHGGHDDALELGRRRTTACVCGYESVALITDNPSQHPAFPDAAIGAITGWPGGPEIAAGLTSTCIGEGLRSRRMSVRALVRSLPATRRLPSRGAEQGEQ